MRSMFALVPGWKPILALGLPLLIGVGALVGAYFYSSANGAGAVPPDPAGAGLELPPPAGLLVDVVGQWRTGLYRVPAKSGVRRDRRRGRPDHGRRPARLPNRPAASRTASGSKVPWSAAPQAAPRTRTNLNSATAEGLALVPGFTEAFAQEVVDYAPTTGGSVDEQSWSRSPRDERVRLHHRAAIPEPVMDQPKPARVMAAGTLPALAVAGRLVGVACGCCRARACSALLGAIATALAIPCVGLALLIRRQFWRSPLRSPWWRLDRPGRAAAARS